MAGISAEEFEREAEAIEEGENDLIAYGSLKDSHWERILNQFGRYFKESELGLIRRFIDENRNPLDVLSVEIQRRFSVISIVEGGPTEVIQESDETGLALEAEPHAVAERKALKRRQ